MPFRHIQYILELIFRHRFFGGLPAVHDCTPISERNVCMADNDPVRIISDNPEQKKAEFGFKGYALTIAGLIANKTNHTPLTIGIYGPWGSGKTTLMESVKDLLGNREFKTAGKFRPCKTVWFQAWKYKNEDEILAALIEEIFRAMKTAGFLKKFGGEIDKLVTSLKPFKALSNTAKAVTGIDLADYLAELKYKAKLGFYPTFQDFFERLLWTYTRIRPKLTGNEEPDDTKGALVIFIDDLDRCPRPKIIQVLETIKLFMDKKGCVFVIGADEDIIVKALSDEYSQDDAARFMEKIVQVNFKLPRIASNDFIPFVENMELGIDAKLFPHLELLMPAMKHNPRQLKRFVNNLNLLDGLLKNQEKPVHIDFKHLLFWNIINLVYTVLAEDIKDNPENLSVLREHIQKIDEEKGAENIWTLTAEQKKEIPESLHGYLDDPDLVGIVRKFAIPKESLKILRTLSGTLESPDELETQGELVEQLERIDFQHDSMAPIEAGDFQYGPDKIPATIETPYEIDIYPVTNSQFEQFILNHGYERKEFWEPSGWKWQQSQKIYEPKHWRNPKWNKPDNPVVGVSWYEANAYAKSVNKELPNEKQWERAARGVQGKEYPWGEEFDPGKCNTRESKTGRTTRVTRYPGGVSPDGCYDMAGNVWEWTSDFYDEDKDSYVLRGGSWSYGASFAQCANRSRVIPVERNDIIGFRCVRTLK